jgi:acetylornithine deacetylase/succinyl-diaminopimelate desuccinylase-like protein
MRLVADQDPNDIARKFTDFVNSFACDTLELDVRVSSRSWPVEAEFDSPEMEAAQRAFEATWGKRARRYRQGGSIGIMGMFQRELGLPIINLGYGNGSNGHAPNEFFRLPYYYKGIETAIHFLHYMAET